MPSIIINFGLQKLQEARSATKEILRNIREAAKGIADTGERKAFLSFAKAKQKERLAEIEKSIRFDTLARDNRNKRAALLGQAQPLIDRAATNAVSKVLSIGSRLGTLGGGLAQVLTQDDPTGAKGLQLGLHALSASGVPLVSQISSIVSQVLSIIQAQEAKRIEQETRALNELVERKLAEADTGKRYREDVHVKAQLDKEAQSVYLGQVDAGWQPRGSRLNDGDL